MNPTSMEPTPPGRSLSAGNYYADITPDKGGEVLIVDHYHDQGTTIANEGDFGSKIPCSG